MTETVTRQSGRQLRAAGYDNVLAADEAVHRGHRAAIEKALIELIDRAEPFTADNVYELLGDDVRPHSQNLLPALIGSWRCRGLLTPIGWRTSTRPSRHSAAVRVWTGTQTPCNGTEPLGPHATAQTAHEAGTP